MGDQEYLSAVQSAAYWQHRRDRAVLALPVVTATWLLLAGVTGNSLVVLRPAGEHSRWTFWLWFAIVVGLVWTGRNIGQRWTWPQAQRRWWGRR